MCIRDSNNPKQLLKDGDTLHIGDIKIQCFLVPGHTWGHMVYLVDDKYLFTGDTLWFGVDGDYCPPLSSGVITTFFGTMSGSDSSVAIVCTHHCIGRYSLPQFFSPRSHSGLPGMTNITMSGVPCSWTPVCFPGLAVSDRSLLMTAEAHGHPTQSIL